jgi:Fe-S-cluster containining protein
VWVKPVEIRRMAGHLGMSVEEFRRRYVRREGMQLSLRERANGDCVLWCDGCTVYDRRPGQCRTFPFWTDGLRSEHTFRLVVRDCPGVGAGRHYTLEEIEEIAAGRRDT